MRALHLFLALGFGAVWVSCGGSGTDNLFSGGLPGASGNALGASGNVTGGSGQTGTGSSGSNTGTGGSMGAGGSNGTAGSVGAGGAGGKGAGGAVGQGGTGTAMGGAAGTAAHGGAGGSATAGMGGGAGSAVVDAGSDASPVPDAGSNPRIRCGNTSCNGDTHFCCLDNTPSCVANGTDGCRASTDQLHCDDATDCGPNQHCCALDGQNGNGGDAVCRVDCVRAVTGRRVQILCRDETQCPVFDPNCSENSQSVFPGYSYCH